MNDGLNLGASHSHAVLVTGARNWTDRDLIRATFSQLWEHWGARSVVRPVLLSGACPTGADALAEQLWREQRFDVAAIPADWKAHGKRAGFIRNAELVDAAVQLQRSGCHVVCTAFIQLCSQPNCAQADDEQLRPDIGGHYSHGTMHCRKAALQAGLPVMDVLAATLPPF